jgi:hypothetical protein
MIIPPDLDVYATSGFLAMTSAALHVSEVADASNWISLIPATIGPIIALIVHRYLAAKAARRRVTATFLLREAEALAESDPERARELRLKAEILKAEGEALHHGVWK